jgi:ketol-acid reductoisomerase
MAGVLARIQDGSFAREWIEENKNGLPNFRTRRGREHNLMIESVGAELRDMMPFLQAKRIKQDNS